MITVSFSLKEYPIFAPGSDHPSLVRVRALSNAAEIGDCYPCRYLYRRNSGTGGGVADLTQPTNLSALVYLPISNTEWQDVDGQVVTVYGPEGVTLRDSGSNTTFLLKPDSIAISTPDSFTVTVGGTVFH